MTDNIQLQVLWMRLLALVEEQAQILKRTAFSPIVRDCGDLSVGIFDTEGRMLALLAFNLGVEAGQLAVVLVIAPLLWLLREQMSYRRIALPVASTALAVAGVAWIIQRTGALA